MSRFDREVQREEQQRAARRERHVASEQATRRDARKKLWDEACEAAPRALQRLRSSPDGWKTMMMERRTIVGGYKRKPVAIYPLVSWRYLGPEHVRGTPENLQWEARVYLRSDGRLVLEKGNLIRLDQRLGSVLDGSGVFGDIPLGRIRDRLRQLAVEQ